MSKAWQQTESFQRGYNKWHPTILGPRLFIMLESLDKYLFWTSACSFACEVCFQRLRSFFASSPWSQSWTGCACFLSLLWGLGTLALCRERHWWSFRKKGFLDSESHFFRNRLPGDGRLLHAGPQVRPGRALCHLWALVESVCHGCRLQGWHHDEVGQSLGDQEIFPIPALHRQLKISLLGTLDPPNQGRHFTSVWIIWVSFGFSLSLDVYPILCVEWPDMI